MPDTRADDFHVEENPQVWQVIERLWQPYMHDLSEFRDVVPLTDGTFKVGRLPTYRDDPDRRGYLALLGDHPVGFALVKPHDDGMALGEFFVVRSVRRHGVGRRLAVHALTATRGQWSVAFQEENPVAASFWRTLAESLSTAAVREERLPVPGKPELPPDTWLRFAT